MKLLISASEQKTTEYEIFFQLDYDNKTHIFENETFIEFFLENGGTFESATALIKFNKSQGNNIFDLHSFEVYKDYVDNANYAGMIASFIDNYEKLLQLIDDDNDPIFGHLLNTKRFLEFGGTYEYAKTLLELKAHNGKGIFDSFSITEFKKNAGTIEYAKEITELRDAKGNTILDNGWNILSFFVDKNIWHQGEYIRSRRSVDTARQFIELTDAEGSTIFRNSNDFITFLRKDGTIEKAREFIAISDNNGKTHFRGDEITLLQEFRVPVEYASRMSQHGLNAKTIVYYYVLGLDDNCIDFENSDKPKALILHPESDPKGDITRSFCEPSTLYFLKSLKQYYDLRIRIIATTLEMFKELDNPAKIDLLILGGHGTKKSLTFGENIPEYEVYFDEPLTKLTTSTMNLSEHMHNLASDAVIFLNSCSNGYGRTSEDNLANFVAKSAPGRKIISCTDPFINEDIRIVSYYPLDLKISGYTSCEDTDYIIDR